MMLTAEQTKKDDAIEIFELICRGWQGSLMLFPITNKKGERTNVLLNRSDLLIPIQKAVNLAKNS